MQITKRNGSKEEFDIQKIRKVINFACEGLDVNPLVLESLFDEVLHEGISTTLLQQNLIEHAKRLCSPEEPDWTIVAGRLHTMNHWANTDCYTKSFVEYVYSQQENGNWTHPAFDKYSQEELEEFGLIIDKERDLQHSYSSVVTAESKYLGKNETIQTMFAGNALIIASIEKPENRLEFAKEVYEALSTRKVSLATPWLANLRKDGNVSSCFIISLNDTLDSIFDGVKKAAQISKEGGGLGIFFGKLRAKGSSLMGTDSAATGVIGWIKIFNDVAVYVNQAGKRKGAFTTALPIWHADIEDFLDIQTEVGDQRKKAHDVKPQVTVPDLFMELKEENHNEWYTFCPFEVKEVLRLDLPELFGDEFVEAYWQCVYAHKDGKLKVGKKYSAKELWKKVMSVQFETGMPYIAFVDEINRHNPNKHVGTIPCGNLCQESYSVVVADELDHTCNLASVVVGRVELDELEDTARLVTRILDNGIELTNPPTPSSKVHNSIFRTVGVGIQGLADIVAREYKSFNDEEFITFVAEKIELGCVKESIKLAEERGAYPKFEGSTWQTGERINKFAQHSDNPEEWQQLQKEIEKYGIRNSQLTSPAPNTSTSIFMDAGAGIMPVYSAFFYEDNKDGPMPVTSMHLKKNPLSYARSVTKFNPWDLTKVTGWLQRFIDTGISAEYIMDKNNPAFSAKHLWDTLNEAWKNKTKTVYYIRTVKKGESLVKDNDICVGCSQ